MKLRIARHTTDLKRITDFYCKILGLEKLGGFSGHQKYDGIFLGIPGKDWHLEFTVSDVAPDHSTDEDDLLVFYFENSREVTEIANKFDSLNIPQVEAANPYWASNGLIYKDPDGFRIVITKEHE